MDIKHETVDKITVIEPQGERLDAAAAPIFKSALVDLINDGTRLILVDLARVDFMDSTGLASLMSSMKTLGDQGEIALCNPSEKVRKLFVVTKLDRGVFRIFGSREQALSEL